MSAIKTGAIVVVVSTLLAAACSSTGDEPSPTQPPTSDPVLIRLGTGDPRGFPDTPVVEGFADAVEELSDGGMRVEVVWRAADDVSVPGGFEQGVVQLVQDGELDLGWIAARAWDTVDVTSFQALQAPFLITDHELLTEVLASPMADEMVAGLGDVGLVGLGLFPDGMRYPLGYTAPMTSLQDFEGADIRLVPSEATEALVRALGGRPVYGLAGDALDAAIKNGDIDGTEVSLGLAASIAPEGSVVTGNVVLFPRVNSLFAGADLMASLSDEQEGILVAAAEDAYAFATSTVTEDFPAFCDAGGELVTASKADVAALERAAKPVYGMLDADPQTKAFIDEIQGLKEGQGVGEAPSSCSAS
jgi:TRAP-type C4-dicarboxylate transport system substrate-binding protein